MKKYYITYIDKSGDCSTIWLYAADEHDAEVSARQEYWDIEDIISIREA